VSEARAKPVPPAPAAAPEGRSLPSTQPPPPPEGAEPFGSIAHLGALPRELEGEPAGATPSSAPPRPSQPPPSSHERSRTRIKAMVVEEVVVNARRDYRRE